MFQIFFKFGDMNWSPYMTPTRFLWSAQLTLDWLIHKDSCSGVEGYEYQIRKVKK